MTVTLNMSSARAWEDTPTGTTGIVFIYTKKDSRVVTLRVSLLDNTGNVKSTISIDVSNVPPDSPTTLTASLSNGLKLVGIVPSSYRGTYTIAAGGSATFYTIPDNVMLLNPLGPLEFVDGKGVKWNTKIMASERITVNNPSTNPVNIEVYDCESLLIPTYSFILKFEELDANGNVLYTQQSDPIIDYPPIIVSESAGDVIYVQVL